ncbi:MAG: flagellar hook assembly protein FlgD [Gammaproteobacteria bacterium]|nr:flagellar hook assembly protein FlgD [Gammaproteobacteria bacterium]
MASTTIPSSSRSELPPGVLSLEAEKQKEVQRSTSLGQAEFLKLMMAQLKNQDPLEPMENGEFLGQMAQFSTVNSIGEMSKQLQGLSDQMASSRMLSSGSLIGRSVLSSGNYGDLIEGKSLDGAVRLTAPVDGAVVYIRNAIGQVMETFELGPAGAGDYPFSWDGSLPGGVNAMPGRYQVDVSVSRGGKTEAAKALLYIPVNSVSMRGQDIVLNLQNGTQIPLSQVSTMR